MFQKKQHTDEELVKGCVANDRYWQEQFYRRFFPTMMEMCLRRTDDKDEAMSIVNNGFLRVFKKIHLYSFKGSLEGWVRRLVWHSLADYFRDQQKYVHFLVFEERDEPVYANTASQLYVEDILKMVNSLPPASAEVFRLYAIEGFSHAEIGEQLGISDGTSKWHLSTARQQLRKMIHQQETSNYAG
ncbi:MAG: sigma-70 family RNA polymerase sigma factor [Bacteroidetes bacterium]|nr:sigma-70 family RNA polymerase sigma factor [Bacteroidota bacterium]